MNIQKSFRFESGKGERTVNIVKIKGKRNQREHLKLAKMRRVCKNQKKLLERLKTKRNGEKWRQSGEIMKNVEN